MMSASEKITYSTVLIKSTYPDGTSGSGTGFIINMCEDKQTDTCIPLIITNWHVVDGSIQTHFEFCMADENGNPIDQKAMSVGYSTDAWVHHPDPDVDLCCLPLAVALRSFETNNLKPFYVPLSPIYIPSNSEIEELKAIENVTMVGYPIGLSDDYNHKPIIRSGITATHIKKDYKGKKEFLVDMACFPGSSGSPIFILNEGIYNVKNSVYVGDRVMFVGILYGGPQFCATGDITIMNIPKRPMSITHIPTNLGIAIKSSRLLEFEKLFKENKPAKNKEENNG